MGRRSQAEDLGCSVWRADPVGDPRGPRACAATARGRRPLTGRWVSTQRGGYLDGRLGLDAINRLRGVPGWAWDAHSAGWEEGFEGLRFFAEREGHASVPTSHLEDGFKLGQWVSVQRNARKSGSLDPERQERLEEVRGWVWDVPSASWEHGFERLKRYVDREGTSAVAHDCEEDGFRLGGWVANRRREKKSDDRALTAERQQRLEALPVWTWKASTKI